METPTTMTEQYNILKEVTEYTIDNFPDIKKDIYGEFYDRLSKKEPFSLQDFLADF